MLVDNIFNFQWVHMNIFILDQIFTSTFIPQISQLIKRHQISSMHKPIFIKELCILFRSIEISFHGNFASDQQFTNLILTANFARFRINYFGNNSGS
eukprot:14433.XXX_404842_405132_1 [CDS] Oithona nana genome sequencing.